MLRLKYIQVKKTVHWLKVQDDGEAGGIRLWKQTLKTQIEKKLYHIINLSEIISKKLNDLCGAGGSVGSFAQLVVGSFAFAPCHSPLSPISSYHSKAKNKSLKKKKTHYLFINCSFILN